MRPNARVSCLHFNEDGKNTPLPRTQKCKLGCQGSWTDLLCSDCRGQSRVRLGRYRGLARAASAKDDVITSRQGCGAVSVSKAGRMEHFWRSESTRIGGSLIQRRTQNNDRRTTTADWFRYAILCVDCWRHEPDLTVGRKTVAAPLQQHRYGSIGCIVATLGKSLNEERFDPAT